MSRGGPYPLPKPARPPPPPLPGTQPYFPPTHPQFNPIPPYPIYQHSPTRTSFSKGRPYYPPPKSDNYGLPELLDIQINRIFHKRPEDWFDPCPDNSPFDGLSIKWFSWNKVNCPFSNWKLWVVKCKEEQSRGNTSVLVLPTSKMASPDFHKFVLHDAKMMVLEGRPSFTNLDDPSKKLKAFPIPLLLFVFYGKGVKGNYHKKPVFGTRRSYERYLERMEREETAINNFITNRRNTTMGLWRISSKGDVKRKCSMCKEWVILNAKNWTFDGARFKSHSKCVWEKRKVGLWKK